MARHFILFVLFTVVAINARAQRFAIYSQADFGFPSLWKFDGEKENSNFIPSRSFSPAIGLEYYWKSGFMISGSVAHQKDEYHLNVYVLPFIVSAISFEKVYKSFPVTFSAGYDQQIGSSDFRVSGMSGIGCGLVKSAQIVDTLKEDGVWQHTDQSGQTFTDTIHVHYSVSDSKTTDFKLKIEMALRLEYRHAHFFLRCYAGIRKWLTSFDELKYHSHHTSEHYNLDQTSTGNYSARPGYVFIGLSLGRYF